MADPPGFLERWSRLKQADRKKAARGGNAAAPATAAPQQPAPQPEDPLADLPPLETLTKDSDFRPFMRSGVPEELRKAALRKLWGSDPVYANLDGLVEYGEDFAEPFRLAGAVATVYRVLEGMPEPARPEAETVSADRQPEDAAKADEMPPPSPVEQSSAEG